VCPNPGDEGVTRTGSYRSGSHGPYEFRRRDSASTCLEGSRRADSFQPACRRAPYQARHQWQLSHRRLTVNQTPGDGQHQHPGRRLRVLLTFVTRVAQGESGYSAENAVLAELRPVVWRHSNPQEPHEMLSTVTRQLGPIFPVGTKMPARLEDLLHP